MDKKLFSLICAITCSLIWGSAFIAQDMGMDYNGPLTFTAGRLFLGFLTLLPFLIIFEKRKIADSNLTLKDISLNLFFCCFELISYLRPSASRGLEADTFQTFKHSTFAIFQTFKLV